MRTTEIQPSSSIPMTSSLEHAHRRRAARRSRRFVLALLVGLTWALTSMGCADVAIQELDASRCSEDEAGRLRCVVGSREAHEACGAPISAGDLEGDQLVTSRHAELVDDRALLESVAEDRYDPSGHVSLAGNFTSNRALQPQDRHLFRDNAFDPDVVCSQVVHDPDLGMLCLVDIATLWDPRLHFECVYEAC